MLTEQYGIKREQIFSYFSYLQSYGEIFQTQKMPGLLDFVPELVITEQFPKYQVKINLGGKKLL